MSNANNKKTAIIIGAGPAGLTAAYELLKNTDVRPIIYEMAGDIGGISKTVNYKGNRMDIGGHRFFSKSGRIIKWWLDILPLQTALASDDLILGRKILFSAETNNADPAKEDKVILLRNRVSRIFYLRKFFDYPVSLSPGTFFNLGLMRIIKIGMSYIRIRLFSIKNEKSLEDFFINRFGRVLYQTFFKDYTEKVWGVSCSCINPEWGAQRIKGLSVTKVLIHAFNKIIFGNITLDQKNTETSLIEQFMYPKFGPGQLWEEVAEIVKKKGGEVHLNQKIIGFGLDNDKITQVRIKSASGEIKVTEADYFISTMPVKDLVFSLETNVPEEVKEVAEGLKYRDFITVGMLLKELKISNNTKLKTVNNIIPDNWIYVQEKDVTIGRIQIFNNWSPYLVKDQNKVWLGLEYFCNTGDALWNMPDEQLKELAQNELISIGFIDAGDILDSVVVRMPKTYPAYFGTYGRFDKIKEYLSVFKNLYLIGRNGMHRYNNMDHSMMTAIIAVENIKGNITSKDNIWNVNIEKEYHEGHSFSFCSDFLL